MTKEERQIQKLEGKIEGLKKVLELILGQMQGDVQKSIGLGLGLYAEHYPDPNTDFGKGRRIILRHFIEFCRSPGGKASRWTSN